MDFATFTQDMQRVMLGAWEFLNRPIEIWPLSFTLWNIACLGILIEIACGVVGLIFRPKGD